MTIDLTGTSRYYAVSGDSWLSQTNRILELATGSLPGNIDYENVMLPGKTTFSFSYQPQNMTLSTLQRQAEDIQLATSLMETAYSGLEQINTRINIMENLAKVIEDYPDMTDVQIKNINSQINYALDEIYQIAQDQKYENIGVLDGILEDIGIYLDLVGDNSINITGAFAEATPEALGLPRQGEAYVRSDNVEIFYEQLNDAQIQVQSQMAEIEIYGESLLNALGDVSSAMWAGSMAELSNPNMTVLSSANAFSLNNDNMYLTLGNVSSNIMFDSKYYDRMLALLN